MLRQVVDGGGELEESRRIAVPVRTQQFGLDPVQAAAMPIRAARAPHIRL